MQSEVEACDCIESEILPDDVLEHMDTMSTIRDLDPARMMDASEMLERFDGIGAAEDETVAFERIHTDFLDMAIADENTDAHKVPDLVAVDMTVTVAEAEAEFEFETEAVGTLLTHDLR